MHKRGQIIFLNIRALQIIKSIIAWNSKLNPIKNWRSASNKKWRIGAVNCFLSVIEIIENREANNRTYLISKKASYIIIQDVLSSVNIR